jgi:long-chain acyl-CoA synthetase
MNNGLPGSTVLDVLVFNQVREVTGRRLRLCLNRTALITRETQEFISLTICLIISRYRMTETSA